MIPPETSPYVEVFLGNSSNVGLLAEAFRHEASDWKEQAAFLKDLGDLDRAALCHNLATALYEAARLINSPCE
jgi:hypothetical protein